MSENQMCLTDDMILQIEEDRIPKQTLERIEAHVSTCDSCRNTFDSALQSPEWTEELRPALLESSDFPQTIEQSHSDEDDASLQADIIRMLGPTDDPHMLGRIGSYEVAGVIGRGGMGIVFKAFDATLDRFVAIKMLAPHLATSGAARQRFVREGKAAAAVVDDYVMPVHAVDEWQGVPYLVMQYSRGRSLQQRLNEQGPLELKEILRIGTHAARGLAAAHAQGLVHRDIKPSNILLSDTVERAMLMDFGLARAVDDASMTRTGTVAGTPQYMSPEQARAESIDQRSDLFSFGSVLYAMCAARPPFRGDSAVAVLKMICDKEPRPITETNPDIPSWLSQIVDRLMAKSPQQRFASAAEVADLLEECLAHVQQPDVTPLPTTLAVHQGSAISSQSDGGDHRATKWLATALLLPAIVALGIIIVLEFNKGTLTITSEANDVPIRIMQDDEVVETMTVSTDGASVRVSAGTYRVVVDGPMEGLTVQNGKLTMQRRGNKSVNVVLAEASELPNESEFAHDNGEHAELTGHAFGNSELLQRLLNSHRSADVNKGTVEEKHVTVDLYAGIETLPQLNSGPYKSVYPPLLQGLNAIEGVTVNVLVIPKASQENKIQLAVIRAPSKELSGRLNDIREVIEKTDIGISFQPLKSQLVHGRVVQRKGNAAQVSLGTDDGIGPGSQFTVIRGNQYVASLTVVSTDPDSCLARIEQSAGLKVGDIVMASVKFMGTQSPAIATGRVLAIDEGHAEISIGVDDGATIGETARVLRGNETVGYVNVTSVEPDRCSAKVVGTLNGFSVKKGDSVVMGKSTTLVGSVETHPSSMGKLLGGFLDSFGDAEAESSPTKQSPSHTELFALEDAFRDLDNNVDKTLKQIDRLGKELGTGDPKIASARRLLLQQNIKEQNKDLRQLNDEILVESTAKKLSTPLRKGNPTSLQNSKHELLLKQRKQLESNIKAAQEHLELTGETLVELQRKRQEIEYQVKTREVLAQKIQDLKSELESPVKPEAIPRLPDIASAEPGSRTALVILSHPAELKNGNSIQQSAISVALGQLSASDYCGVLNYTPQGTKSTSWMWRDEKDYGLVMLRDRRSDFNKALASSRPGDFAAYDEALQMALDALKNSPVQNRHMLVLTDGDPALQDESILDRFADAGITICVVHADLHGEPYYRVPKLMAKKTGGHYWVLNAKAPSSSFEALFRDAIKAIKSLETSQPVNPRSERRAGKRSANSLWPNENVKAWVWHNRNSFVTVRFQGSNVDESMRGWIVSGRRNVMVCGRFVSSDDLEVLVRTVDGKIHRATIVAGPIKNFTLLAVEELPFSGLSINPVGKVSEGDQLHVITSRFAAHSATVVSSVDTVGEAKNDRSYTSPYLINTGNLGDGPLTKGSPIVTKYGKFAGILSNAEGPEDLVIPADFMQFVMTDLVNQTPDSGTIPTADSLTDTVESKMHLVAEEGEWKVEDGATLQIDSREEEPFGKVYRATLTWKETADRPALRYEVDIAGDEHYKWAIAWQESKSMIWLLAKGNYQSGSSIRSMDYSVPANIVTSVGYGDDRFDLRLPELSKLQESRRHPFSIGSPWARLPKLLDQQLVEHFGLGKPAFGISSLLPTGPEIPSGEYAESALLANGWTFQGRIEDADGKPMEGVHVYVTTEWSGTAKLAKTITDDEGNYKLMVRPDLMTFAQQRRISIFAERQGVGLFLPSQANFHLRRSDDEDPQQLLESVRLELHEKKSGLPKGVSLPSEFRAEKYTAPVATPDQPNRADFRDAGRLGGGA